MEKFLELESGTLANSQHLLISEDPSAVEGLANAMRQLGLTATVTTPAPQSFIEPSPELILFVYTVPLATRIQEWVATLSPRPKVIVIGEPAAVRNPFPGIVAIIEPTESLEEALRTINLVMSNNAVFPRGTR